MKKKDIVVKLAEDQDMPIAMLVQVASQFESSVHIEHENKFINAKSIMGMMTIGIDNNQTITVVADGLDETDAIDSIEKYLTGQE